MTLHEKIKEEIIVAMKARDEIRLRASRNLLAGFINDLVARRKKPSEMLSDDEAITVISRLAKQRKDSIEQFKAGGRDDLVKSEEAELVYLEQFLPQMLGEKEIRAVAEKKMKELGIQDKTKIGPLLGAVMKELKGKADGTFVKKIVEELLEKSSRL